MPSATGIFVCIRKTNLAIYGGYTSNIGEVLFVKDGCCSGLRRLVRQYG